jgi:peroxiredoxin
VLREQGEVTREHVRLDPTDASPSSWASRRWENSSPERARRDRRGGGPYSMRSDIKPGGTFPDYELPDQGNVPRRLSELQGEDPLILTLARGHYCPKEHQQHLELVAFYPQIAVAYTQIATISTDAHHTSQEFRASIGAQWPFLSDPERVVQRDLEIQEYTDPENDPMIPHTLVLKPGLVIHSIYNGYWFWGRPSIAELWSDLRAVNREIRPDWDLSAPGLREAWDAGDYSPFHGWNKRDAPDPTASVD